MNASGESKHEEVQQKRYPSHFRGLYSRKLYTGLPKIAWIRFGRDADFSVRYRRSHILGGSRFRILGGAAAKVSLVAKADPGAPDEGCGWGRGVILALRIGEKHAAHMGNDAQPSEVKLLPIRPTDIRP